MAGGASAPEALRLRDRRDECAVLDRLISAVRAGRSGALVVRGEDGIGKTALLDYAVESASDLEVVRAVGVESEKELPFAALHQLCAAMVDRLDRLLSDPVLRDQLGVKAQTRSGEFSWTQSADAMHSVLKAVRSGHFVSGVV